jgi:hypothetical protein
MRVRFSLQVFFVVFTLFAMLLGAGAQYVNSVKAQVRRQNGARLELGKLGFEVDSPMSSLLDDKPTAYVQFLRKYVEPDAYRRVEIVDYTVDADRPAPDGLSALRLLKDVYGLQTLQVADVRIDAEACGLLSLHPDLTLCANTCTVDPIIAARFHQLTNLRELAIYRPLDDDMAEAISQLPQLRSLSVNTSKLSQRGFQSLRRLGALYRLDLTEVVDRREPLEALVSGKAIQELRLFVAANGDEAVQELSNAREMKKLTLLCYDSPPENVIEVVSKLPSLQRFAVWGGKSVLKKSALAELVNCRNLEHCDLGLTPLTDAEFIHLAQLPRIKSLSFVGNPSELEINRFFEAHPNCAITIRPTEDPKDGYLGQLLQLVNGKLDVSGVTPTLGGD